MLFDHQGAFIKMEHAVSDLLEVQLQFRTLKPDTILLYTETVSDTDQDTGYIRVCCPISFTFSSDSHFIGLIFSADSHFQWGWGLNEVRRKMCVY